MTEYKELDVSSLILKVRGGSDDAFEELIERYKPMLKKLGKGFASSIFTENEAYSEACIALHKSAMTYDLTRNDVTFGLYARICAYRRLCDMVGREAKSSLSIAEIDMDSLSYDPACEERLVRGEWMSRALEFARGILSDYEYQVFLLYLQGYTTQESSRLLSKSAKSVDNAKNRCFKRLRDQVGMFSDI